MELFLIQRSRGRKALITLRARPNSWENGKDIGIFHRIGRDDHTVHSAIQLARNAQLK
jgi:hypothetical protein